MTRTTFDGFALFTAIGSNPEAFAAAASLVDQAAPKILFAALKHKELTLPLLAAIKTAVGPQNFDLALDTLGDRDLKTLLKKVDGHWPEAKTADSDALRGHVVALADNCIKPAPKPEKPEKPSKKARAARPAKAEAAGWPSAMSARPRRTG